MTVTAQDTNPDAVPVRDDNPGTLAGFSPDLKSGLSR